MVDKTSHKVDCGHKDCQDRADFLSKIIHRGAWPIRRTGDDGSPIDVIDHDGMVVATIHARGDAAKQAQVAVILSEAPKMIATFLGMIQKPADNADSKILLASQFSQLLYPSYCTEMLKKKIGR
jgi:hypothetical protein